MLDLSKGLPTITARELKFSRARGLAEAAIRNPYVKLIACFRKENTELIQIVAEVELPQYPPVPINQFEPIVIRIENDHDIPHVVALRDDFPKTIHQNIVPEGFPISLCLYEDPWEEISPFITPELFIERIREWLRRGAIEELHLGDQPLEPFLVTNQKVLIDEEVLKSGLPKNQVLVGFLSGNLPHMIPVPIKELKKISSEKSSNFLGLRISAPPTFTQNIPKLPKSLNQLITLLNKIDIDLLSEMKAFIQELMQHYKIIEYGHFRIILFLHLPKSRSEGGETESHEYWAFIINSLTKDVGIALGVLDSKSDVGAGYLLKTPEAIESNLEIDNGYSNISVEPCSPVFTFTPSLARKTSGIVDREIGNVKIGVIGLGALGSTVVMNLVRQGIGKWIFVDNDLLLPHNLARHALSGAFVGLSKAAAMKQSIEIDYQDSSLVEQYGINYLSLSEQQNVEHRECCEKLSAANLILDFSASGAVERSLSIDNTAPPRLSVYLVPSGKYCVASYEGIGRTIRLNDLNQQLMAKIAAESEFQDFFETDENNFQYAGSCRDLSRVISNDWFLGYAGVLSRFIKNSLDSYAPKLSLFRWQEDPQSLSEIPVLISNTVVSEFKKWKIRTSESVIIKMKELRNKGLPNETGGVLLGKVDFAAQTIYVSYILSSPSDSKEWPFAYIRGVRGLDQEVKKIGSVTKGAISYIGEWHSHPKGASIRPSKDDKTSLKWLADIQSSVGYPGLLAIMGDEDLPNYLLLDTKSISK